MVRISLLCSLLFLPSLMAGNWSSKGEITLESRQFTDDDNPITQDGNIGLFARLEARYKNGPWRLKLRGFGRIDHEDDSRDLTAIEEAWFGYRKGSLDFRMGYQMLNWTATEGFHPADIINSRNLDSKIENPEKLGELMASLKYRIGEGALTMYYLPRYEEPILPEASSRLSFLPDGFQFGDALWLEGDGELTDDSYGSQWGGRYTQTIGDVDFSLYYLDHMDRQTPSTIFNDGSPILTPVYLRVQDFGGTYLQVLGSWIIKMEYSNKDFEDQTNPVFAALNQVDHQAAALGLEYIWPGETGSESTILLEGQNFFDANEEERASLGLFQRDVLVGYRYARNDTMGREFLITAIFDVERSKEYLVNLNYKQRISDTWKIETGLRYIEAPTKGQFPIGLEVLDESNQVFVNVTRSF